MPRFSRARPQPIASALPSDLHVPALTLEAVARLGLINQVDRDLALSRRGGHTGNALFALAVLLFMSGPAWGIRPFTARLKGSTGRILAAVGRVGRLPSSASVSRMLAALPLPRARACVDRLLRGDEGMRALLSSPHVLHRDASARWWHVLDVDPTVIPFRQRALPEGPELPDPVRLSPGEPGYTGHKRGEIRIRMVPILHAGAGVWLGVRMMMEEGSAVLVAGELVRLGLAAVKGTRPGAGVVVRYDGEFGSVGAMRATLDGGADVLTRLSRYRLLDSPEAAAVHGSRGWHAVPSGGSGPPREAAELGFHVLQPSARAAGSKEPVTVRVLVTRSPHVGPPTHGVVRGGYQYELFATSLLQEAWPAEDVVNLYFGRAGIECRFAQEDREFAVDRTFSKAPAGQEWMAGVGLFLWNLLVCKGTESAPLPARAPSQSSRPVDAAPGEPIAAGVVAGSPTAPPPTAVVSPPPPVSASTHSKPAPENAGASAARTAREPERKLAEAALWAITCDVFADLKKRPAWTFDHSRKRIFCPNRMPFVHVNVRPAHRPADRERGMHDMRIQPTKMACQACPLRAECIGPKRPGAATESPVRVFTRRVPAPTGERVAELLERRKLEPRRALRDDGPLLPPPPPDWTPAPPRKVGDRLVVTPLFLPSEARKQARAALAGLRVELLLHPAAGHPVRRHPLLARDDDDRQHRRATWAHRGSVRSNVDWVEFRPAEKGKPDSLRRLLGLEPA